MSNNEKDNEDALEWLQMKTNKGEKPDYIKKGEIEKISNKFVRKFIENPFVPVGALATVGFLGVGLKNMYDGNRLKSQMMMRGRIAAQGFTVIAILGGLFYQGLKALKEAEKEQQENSLIK